MRENPTKTKGKAEEENDNEMQERRCKEETMRNAAIKAECMIKSNEGGKMKKEDERIKKDDGR